MSDEIVNYKIKPEHADGPFSEFVRFDGTHYRCLNSISGKWMLDLNIVEHLDCYDEIEDLTETPEEKEIFDNWPSERRIDIIATNGNTGEHYCDKRD